MKRRLCTTLLVAGMIAVPALAVAQGAVYTATNDAGSNQILIFDRAADGLITPAGASATGGLGTGGGLGNQGGIVLTRDGSWLLVVNAGSDDVSVFRVTDDGLQLTSRTPSGGRRPVSVTVSNDLVYVLNAGGSLGDVDNITGFRLSLTGQLQPIAGSGRPLSGPNTSPAQIGFSPNGAFLVVTEKTTNVIDVFGVNDDGTATAPQVFPSAGPTPFGFSFGKRQRLLVSEAVGGAADASSASAYQLNTDGTLTLIQGPVPTTETAACWLVVSKDGRFAYVTNTGSGSISGYRIGHDGALALLDADGRTGETGPGTGPIDIAFSVNDHYLYVLNSNGSLSAFVVQKDGGLAPLQTVGDVPASANGLAAQ